MEGKTVKAYSPWISIEGLPINDEACNKLQRIGNTRHYKKGSVILGYGDCPEGIYFITSGSVCGRYLSQNGEEKVIFVYKSPCFFGEAPFINDETTNMDAITLNDATISFISRDAINKYIYPDKTLYLLILKSMARKTQAVTEQLNDALYLSPIQRVQKALQYLALEQGIMINDRDLAIKITQIQVANITGLHRVTITRIFNKLKSSGIIKGIKRSEVILNSDMLFE
jgi:cAMP-binding proteins - catabolite gene activator and regulatory subunit of cAMP-dependent protein kinases